MPDGYLIKKKYENSDLDISIYDIFTREELEEFETIDESSEILAYDLDDIGMEAAYFLNDKRLVEEYGCQFETITDEIRLDCMLPVFEALLKESIDSPLYSDIHIHTLVDELIVCFDIYYNGGMDFERAYLVGVFKTDDDIYQYYKEQGKLCVDVCGEEAKKKFILDNWVGPR